MRSDAGHWDRLQELFHLAEKVPITDRERALRDACPDPDLRARVLSLLQAAEDADTARPEPAVSDGERRAPTVFGPYSVIQRLGSGGNGTVYLVERNAGGVRQRAALKVLSPAAAGPSFVDRFHREQRILASLDHPYITRMLDAGLDDNAQPYLVMEYVEGRQLDAFCDDRKLSVEESLGLFLKICEVVDYAHRNLVVHLDLKPSNILVTAEGIPKLLDFGTSKLIVADAEDTTTLLVTPSYASPEQLRNEAVTTACDVYALGIILYELLAGRRPSGDSSIAAMIERALEEKEPTRLDETITAEAAEHRNTTESRLRSLLNSELSTIVRKCLMARPRDRYASVAALSEDLHRYRDGWPVLARPQTALYRARKFVRRHWLPVSAAAVFLIGLSTATGAAIYQARVARAEATASEAITRFLEDVFYSGEPDDVKDRTVLQAMEIARSRLKEINNQPEVEMRLRVALGYVYMVNSRLPQAEQELRRAEKLARQTGNQELLAATLLSLSDVLPDQTQVIRAYKESLALARSMGNQLSPNLRMRIDSEVGQARGIDEGHSPEVEHLLREAVRIGRTHPVPKGEFAMSLSRLGQYLRYENRIDEAEPLLNEAVALLASHPTVNMNLALDQLAAIRVKRGDLEGGERLYRERRDLLMRLQGPENGTTMDAQSRWAGLWARLGHPNEALQEIDSEMAYARKAFAPGTLGLWFPLSMRAYILNVGDKPSEALASAREGLACLGPTFTSDPRLAQLEVEAGIAFVKMGRYAEATPYLEESQRIYLAYPGFGPGSYQAERTQEYLAKARSMGR